MELSLTLPSPHNTPSVLVEGGVGGGGAEAGPASALMMSPTPFLSQSPAYLSTGVREVQRPAQLPGATSPPP